MDASCTARRLLPSTKSKALARRPVLVSLPPALAGDGDTELPAGLVDALGGGDTLLDSSALAGVEKVAGALVRPTLAW